MNCNIMNGEKAKGRKFLLTFMSASDIFLTISAGGMVFSTSLLAPPVSDQG